MGQRPAVPTLEADPTMTGVRHATASAIVLDDAGRVLLIHHNKVGRWLYPGGHIDPNEDPAQAALREVREETGIRAELIADPLPALVGVTALVPPWLITEMAVVDQRTGPHRHIDHVYVCRPVGGELTPQLAEVAGCRWVAVADLGEVDTPPDLPVLIRHAAAWASTRR